MSSSASAGGAPGRLPASGETHEVLDEDGRAADQRLVETVPAVDRVDHARLDVREQQARGDARTQRHAGTHGRDGVDAARPQETPGVRRTRLGVPDRAARGGVVGHRAADEDVEHVALAIERDPARARALDLQHDAVERQPPFCPAVVFLVHVRVDSIR